MKKYKDYQIVLLALLSLLLNFGGKIVADRFRLPMWLDSFGTFLMAYVVGPFCAAIVGAAANILYGFLDPVSFAYSITSIAIALLVTSVIFTILSPAAIRSLTNEISPVGKTAVDGSFVVNMENVLHYVSRLIIFIVVSFITSFISGFILNTIIQRFSKDLRGQISSKINRMPLDYYDTTQTGDILSVALQHFFGNI